MDRKRRGNTRSTNKEELEEADRLVTAVNWSYGLRNRVLEKATHDNIH